MHVHMCLYVYIYIDTMYLKIISCMNTGLIAGDSPYLSLEKVYSISAGQTFRTSIWFPLVPPGMF